ncbi:MAG: oligosaccharide flippase family protein, partial [Pyrinomonadaceae bacterium]
MNPFRNIFQLSVGDFLAKTLNFLAFVYLARVLGVSQYGVLEFAVSILTYLLVLADGGLELWATREAAQDRSVRRLAARVIPLRLLLAAGAFAALVALRPLLPDYANLEPVLLIFGLCVFAQALSLKWVFMGQEKMARVGGALVIGQIVFALGVFALVRDPSQLVWVAALRLASELAVAVYFARLFSAAHGGLRLALTLRGAPEVLRAA